MGEATLPPTGRVINPRLLREVLAGPMNLRFDVTLSGDSRLELFPMQVKQDDDQFILGQPATGAYLALSGEALAATRLLAGGRTIAMAKASLAPPHPGGQIRFRSLIETLLAAGLVKAVDGQPMPEPLAPRRYHLRLLRRRHVAWVFSRPAVVVYVALVGAALAIVLADPRYLPRPANILIASSTGWSLALLWCVALIVMGAHELAHLLAATFLGVRASFSLGSRLFFAVAQTDLTDLWLVDRPQRYLAYAAGMACDLVLASAALIALWLNDHLALSLPVVLCHMLRTAILVQLAGVLWQFNVYLRTDVYYLIANATGCRNLARDAARYVRATLAGVFNGARPDCLAGVPARERPMVRAFALLMVAGTTGLVAVGLLYAAAILRVLLSQPLGPGAPTGVAHASSIPLLASLGLTACWLAGAAAVRRRRRARVQFQVVGPEDL